MPQHLATFIAFIFTLSASAVAQGTIGNDPLCLTLDGTGKVMVLSARKGTPLLDANGLSILLMVNDEWSRSLSRQP